MIEQIKTNLEIEIGMFIIESLYDYEDAYDIIDCFDILKYFIPANYIPSRECYLFSSF